jgi:pimeloyl-ACP methyl ester carboxylesterase
MPTANVNDIQLAYVEEGRGQPVVFVHGGLGDYRHFARQIAPFAERHRAIAVSCRGYWPNEPLRPDENITLDTFVEDIAAFIIALDAGPVHLVGHSSPGGFGSLRLAQHHPELLRSVVLLEPPAFPLLGVNIPPSPSQLIRLFFRNRRAGVALIRMGLKGMRPAIKAFERGDDELAVRTFLSANKGTTTFWPTDDLLAQMIANASPLKAQLRSGFPEFSEADARGINVPTLLVSGDRSPVHLTSVTDRLQQLLPNVERLNIADAGHAMFISHPVEFNLGVIDFIDRHTINSRSRNRFSASL